MLVTKWRPVLGRKCESMFDNPTFSFDILVEVKVFSVLLPYNICKAKWRIICFNYRQGPNMLASARFLKSKNVVQMSNMPEVCNGHSNVYDGTNQKPNCLGVKPFRRVTFDHVAKGLDNPLFNWTNDVDETHKETCKELNSLALGKAAWIEYIYIYIPHQKDQHIILYGNSCQTSHWFAVSSDIHIPEIIPFDMHCTFFSFKQGDRPRRSRRLIAGISSCAHQYKVLLWNQCYLRRRVAVTRYLMICLFFLWYHNILLYVDMISDLQNWRNSTNEQIRNNQRLVWRWQWQWQWLYS